MVTMRISSQLDFRLVNSPLLNYISNSLHVDLPTWMPESLKVFTKGYGDPPARFIFYHFYACKRLSKQTQATIPIHHHVINPEMPNKIGRVYNEIIPLDY